MSVQKEFFSLLSEMIVFLFLGFIFTTQILRTIYENAAVHFKGNVWVNWLGVSYILFFLYTICYKVLGMKNDYLINGRLQSIIFWILLIASIYVVMVPILIGENPF